MHQQCYLYVAVVVYNYAHILNPAARTPCCAHSFRSNNKIIHCQHLHRHYYHHHHSTPPHPKTNKQQQQQQQRQTKKQQQIKTILTITKHQHSFIPKAAQSTRNSWTPFKNQKKSTKINNLYLLIMQIIYTYIISFVVRSPNRIDRGECFTVQTYFHNYSD